LKLAKQIDKERAYIVKIEKDKTNFQISNFAQSINALGLTLQMKQIKNPIKPKKPLLSKRDLVHVIEKARQQNLKLGTDFGIISYNETPLKKVVSNGITTISTDFTAMGKLLAQMVLTGKKEQIENKNALIIRNSL
jgi:hypothetical protein